MKPSRNHARESDTHPMKLRPRFVFHANAAAMGGRIGKPKDILIESGAASSLTAGGGRSTSKTAKGTFGDQIVIDENAMPDEELAPGEQCPHEQADPCERQDGTTERCSEFARGR